MTAGAEVSRVQLYSWSGGQARHCALRPWIWFQQWIREITRRAKGVSMKTTMEELAPSGAGLAQLFRILRNARGADRFNRARWVRLRLRAAFRRQWKTPRRRRAARWNSGYVCGWPAIRLAVGLAPWHQAKAKSGSL